LPPNGAGAGGTHTLPAPHMAGAAGAQASAVPVHVAGVTVASPPEGVQVVVAVGD
jgi:hypothetical protein